MNANLDPAALWNDYRPTSVVELPALAHQASVAHVCAKLENERPLGNFKALGGMVASLRALARAAPSAPGDANASYDPNAPRNPNALHAANTARAADASFDAPVAGARYTPHLICASDGNHGLAVTAAAVRVGARATIYLPTSTSPIRAHRIKAIGGEVVSVDGTYDDAVNAAAAAAARGAGILVPDTSPDPNDAVVKDVMAGYSLITQELRDQLQARPSHVFVQAGVGGLAAAVAEGLRDFMSEPRRVFVVEPEAAACVSHALTAGRPVQISGPLETAAEMLSCGLASAPAIEILKRHDAHSVLVGEKELQAAVEALREAGGPRTTPSGAASLAGFLRVASSAELRDRHQLALDSNVLFLVTEGAT